MESNTSQRRGDERDEGRERLEMSQEEVQIEAFDEPM